jgi:hypothetical protein
MPKSSLAQCAETPLSDLLEMLTTMRPAGSRTEAQFIARWLAPLGVKPDAVGNQIVRIGAAPVLWSCHTDTVHREPGFQRIARKGNRIALHAKERRASCLGADCTTGVWLMREMVLARVPGLYVFHAGEEVGGIGSNHIANNTPHLLDGIRFAIAFDRKGTDSVITHQFRGRCCSTAFACSLAWQLPGAYVLDDTGSFTDTANYTDIVPECSNISVGYTREHSRFETQSISHALALRAALLRLDSSKLVCERNPLECEPDVHFAGILWDDLPAEAEEEDDFTDGPFTSAWYEDLPDACIGNYIPRRYKY